MIRIRWLVLASVIVMAILLVPLTGYSAYKHGSVGMTVSVTASRLSASDMNLDYTVQFTFGDPHSVSYLRYIGTWWGNVFHLGQASSAGVRVIVIIEWVTELDGKYTRTTKEFGYDYSWGDKFAETYKFNVEPGAEIQVRDLIYSGFGANDYTGLWFHATAPIG
jgi:hypothetical protein